MKNPKKDLFNLYAITSLFSGGRLFVGAISVLYILSHGIGIAEFATIKSLQVTTFLIFDIPAGLFIKRFGYKNSLIITFILSVLGLSIYITGNNLFYFLVAEFITALSLCLFPTSFTDFTMNFLRKNPDILIEKIFHRSDMYASIATLICGGIGGYFYNLDKTLPYYAGIFLQMFGLYFVLKINYTNQEQKNNTNPNTINSLIRVFNMMRNINTALLIPVLLLFIIQLTIQPLFHYWQPLFYEINDTISGNFLGCVFVTYSICSIFLNFAFSKLSQNSFFRSVNCIFLMLLIATLFYFISAVSQSITVTFVCFSLLQGFLFTSLTCISTVINRQIDDGDRPITLKAISLLSRVGMLISFGSIQLLSDVRIHSLYFLSASLLCIAILVIKLIEITKSNTKLQIEV